MNIIYDIIFSKSNYSYSALIARAIFLNNHSTKAANMSTKIRKECKQEKKMYEEIHNSIEILTNSEVDALQKDSLQFEYLDIEIKTHDDQKINAWIIKKKNISNYTPIIFFHGTGDNRESFYNNYKVSELIERGCLAMIIDYRGFGDSEGEFITEHIASDIKQCIDAFFKIYNDLNEYINMKVNLLGMSFGCSIICKYLELYGDDNIDNIFLFSPFVSIVSVMNNNAQWRILKRFFRNIDAEIKRSFEIDISDLDLNINTDKIMMFRGKNDNVVPESDILKLKIKFKNLIEKENCDHNSILINKEIWDNIFSMIESNNLKE